MRSEDPRLQLVRRFEEIKIAKGLKSVLKDAANYANDLGITIKFDKTKTLLTNEDQKTMEVQQTSPRHISDFLTQAKNSIYMTGGLICRSQVAGRRSQVAGCRSLFHQYRKYPNPNPRPKNICLGLRLAFNNV